MCCFARTPPKKSRLASRSVSSLKTGGWQGCVTKYATSSRLKTRPAQGAAGSRCTSSAPRFMRGTTCAVIGSTRLSGTARTTKSAWGTASAMGSAATPRFSRFERPAGATSTWSIR